LVCKLLFCGQMGAVWGCPRFESAAVLAPARV